MINGSNTNRLANDIKNVPQRTRVTGVSLATSQSKQPGNFADAPVLGLDIINEERHSTAMKCNLLEVDDVCGLLKIGRSTLYSLVNKKAITAVKLVNRTLFREEDVCNFVATLPTYQGGPNGF